MWVEDRRRRSNERCGWRLSSVWSSTNCSDDSFTTTTFQTWRDLIILFFSPSLIGLFFFFFFFFLSLIFLLGHKSSSIFLRLKKIYGANVYVGLRIPDADTASRQSIDIVLLTKQYSLFSSFQSICYFGNGYYCKFFFDILQIIEVWFRFYFEFQLIILQRAGGGFCEKLLRNSDNWWRWQLAL